MANVKSKVSVLTTQEIRPVAEDAFQSRHGRHESSQVVQQPTLLIRPDQVTANVTA